MSVDAFAASLADLLDPPPPPWPQFPTPGALAAHCEPGTLQTPALDAIDTAAAGVLFGDTAKQMIFAPPQIGKALALDTPIATPDGWTTMGALRVGDRVFDRHGEPCSVTWVSPIWSDRECYTVRTGDGEAIVADAEHEWPAKLDRRGSEQLRTTRVLARTRSKNAQITALAALNLPEADLPLDPYVLGAWLGDGHTSAAMMTLHPDDAEIRDRFADGGFPLRQAGGNRFVWYMAPAGWRQARGNPSPARAALIAAGVWGNKHIPAAYLRGSEKQRLALLQGLIDTDGYVDPRKGIVEFCTTLPHLAEQVCELVFSLGAKATVKAARATIDGRDCGLKYRVCFMRRDAAWMTRKAERCRDSSVSRVRYVWAEPTEPRDTICIEVDSPDHTFLAGRTLLPTHNSQRISRWTPLTALAADSTLRIAVISADTEKARRWGRAIRRDLRNNPDLGLQLQEDSQAAGRWETTAGGSLFCASYASGTTGQPVDLMIIDDPFKDRASAESKTIRDRVWEFWENDGKTRARRVILMHTRWHTDDLAGRLLEREPGEWSVLSIPAIAEDDDPLGREVGQEIRSANPKLHPPGFYYSTQKTTSPYVWSSLFQQRPTAAEGGIFKRGDWRYFDLQHEPQSDGGRRFLVLDGDRYDLDTLSRFITIDLATSTKTSADFTVASAWAISLAGDLVLLDRKRDRVPEIDHAAFIEPLRQRWLGRYDVTHIESRMFGTTLVYALGRAGVPVAELDADVDKLTRALPYAGLVRQRKVWLPRTAPWLGEWLDEHADFPNTAHDDQVDTGSYAARVAIAHWLPPEAGVVTEARRMAARTRDPNDPAEYDLMSMPM